MAYKVKSEEEEEKLAAYEWGCIGKRSYGSFQGWDWEF